MKNFEKSPDTFQAREHISCTKANCRSVQDKLKELQASFAVPQLQAETERALKLVVNN